LLRVRYLIGVVVVGAIAGVTALQVAGSTLINVSQPTDQHTLQVLTTSTLPNNQQLPPIVARVGTRDITKVEFARAVAIATDNATSRHQALTQGQIWRNALNGLIQDVALYDRAQAEGIAVSDADLASYMADQRAGLLNSEKLNPSVVARINATIAAAGDADLDSFMKDPKTLASYRRDMMKGRLIAVHVGQHATQSAVNNFIQQTIAQTQVQIYIVIPA
jgi:hypothetical protein